MSRNASLAARELLALGVLAAEGLHDAVPPRESCTAALMPGHALAVLAEYAAAPVIQREGRAAMTMVTTSMMAVSGPLIMNSSTKEPTILSVQMNRFSGPWCASSDMSNRSVVIFDIMTPVLWRS